MAKLTSEELIASLKEMTILELNELVKAIEEEFGVSAAAPVAVAAAADDAGEDEGPSSVNVVLTELTGSKVAVIKVLRDALGLGMMDAKKLTDDLPATLKEGVSVSEADELKAKLVEAGAVIEYK